MALVPQWAVRFLGRSGFTELRADVDRWTGARSESVSVARVSVTGERTTIAVHCRARISVAWGAGADERAVVELARQFAAFPVATDRPDEIEDIDQAFGGPLSELGFKRTFACLHERVLEVRYARDDTWRCIVTWRRGSAELDVLLARADAPPAFTFSGTPLVWDARTGVNRWSAPRLAWLVARARPLVPALTATLEAAA